MKLLHLANGNLFGGIETFLVTLSRVEQQDQVLRNSFVLSHEGRLAEELRASGAPFEIIGGVRLRRPWAVRRARAEVLKKVERLEPKVVIAHGPWAYFVFGHALRKSAIPLVFWQHGLADRGMLHLLASLHKPTAVIANSALTASSTSRIFPGVQTHVVRYPVRELRPTRSREEVRQEIGAGEEVVILQTSRFEPWKGHALLLKALLRIAHLPWQLWLAGGQPRLVEQKLRTELEQLARQGRVESKIRFLGERRDIPDLLGAADVFCQPNTGPEPYGLAPVEALGAGLPVIATEAGATALQVSPEWGRCVPVSVDALAEVLAELIQSAPLRVEMSRSARAHFAVTFSPVKLLADVTATLQRISSSGT